MDFAHSRMIFSKKFRRFDIHLAYRKMTDLYIRKSPTTPLIDLRAGNGRFVFEGRSIPEDPGIFFGPVHEWLEEYFKSPAKESVFDFRLEYINSGSSKYFLSMLRFIAQHHGKLTNCIINWHYEEDDESVLELGQHYKNALKLPFNLIEFI